MPIIPPKGRFAFAYGRRDMDAVVEHVYSEKSRVWFSTEHAQAVRVELGEGWSPLERRGWVSEGKYYSEQSIRDLLGSLNKTKAGGLNEVDLKDVFDQMTPRQKSQVAEIVVTTDWEAWFEEFGSGDEYELQQSMDHQIDQLADLLEQMGDIFLGRIGRLD